MAKRKAIVRFSLVVGLVLLAHYMLLVGLPLPKAKLPSNPLMDPIAFTTRSIETAQPPANNSKAAQGAHVKQPRTAATATAARPTRTALADNSAQSTSTSAPAGEETPSRADTSTNEPLPTPHPAELAPNAVIDAPQNSQDTAPAPAQSQQQTYALPDTVRLKYNGTIVLKGIANAVGAELLWQQDGKNYNTRLEISHWLFGSRVQTSKGSITENGLAPLRFGDKASRGSEVAAHFQRDKNTVSFSSNSPEVALLPNAQDQLSIFLQLSAMLAGEPGRFPTGSILSFQAIGPRSSENWAFEIQNTEEITLPGGKVQALHLVRMPMGGYEQRVELWLATEIAYLPLRIKLVQSNGDLAELLWASSEKP
jgi:hypothetical protein